MREHKGKNLLLFPTDYTIVDIETTGLSTQYDEIIEICAVRYRNKEFVEKFKPKKTTDDCCTPPTIYEIVKQWPATNTGLTPPKLCGHDEEVCKIRGRPENSGR